MLNGIPVFGGRIGFHRLDMISIVMAPAADLPVHIVNFPVMCFDQFVLIRINLFFYFSGKKSHLLYLMLMIARFSGS